MTLSEKDVLHILRLVEESSFDSLQLEYGDIKLAVSKSGDFVPQVAQAPAQVAADAPVAPPTPAVQQSTEKQGQSPAPDNVAPQPQASATATASSSLVAVEAPVVGVFYAAPEPGADPFVQVGSEVDADTTVGLVEDSQLVEYGQPLFMVEPDGGAR